MVQGLGLLTVEARRSEPGNSSVYAVCSSFRGFGVGGC